MASGDKYFIADKETLDNIKAAVGTNSDSPSTSGSTLFGKIKGLINLIGAYNASASSSGTTLFARLNYILSWLTGARGTKIDNIGTPTTSGDTVFGMLDRLPIGYNSLCDSLVNTSSTVTVQASTVNKLRCFTTMSAHNITGYIEYTFSGEGRVSFYLSNLSDAATREALEANNVWKNIDNLGGTGAKCCIPVDTISLPTTSHLYLYCVNESTNRAVTVSSIYLTSGAYSGTKKVISCVKSVQRGFGSGGIKINLVNPGKCQVRFYGSGYEGSFENAEIRYRLFPGALVISNTISETPNVVAVNYEITEFY